MQNQMTLTCTSIAGPSRFYNRLSRSSKSPFLLHLHSSDAMFEDDDEKIVMQDDFAVEEMIVVEQPRPSFRYQVVTEIDQTEAQYDTKTVPQWTKEASIILNVEEPFRFLVMASFFAIHAYGLWLTFAWGKSLAPYISEPLLSILLNAARSWGMRWIFRSLSGY